MLFLRRKTLKKSETKSNSARHNTNSKMQVQLEAESYLLTTRHVVPQQQQQNNNKNPQYSLARDRAKRQVRKPTRYAYADLIAYSLNVEQE